MISQDGSRDSQDDGDWLGAADCGNAGAGEPVTVTKVAGLTREQLHQQQVRRQQLTALHNAVKAGDVQVVKVVLEKGRGVIDVNDVCDERMPDGRMATATALSVACAHDQMEVVKVLVEEEGADVHVENERALVMACAAGAIDIAAFLVERHGADVHADGDSALGWACKLGQIASLRFLVSKGVDVHTGDERALRVACNKGHERLVRVLLEEFGADVHAARDGPLRFACKGSHEGIVRHLVARYGADPRSSDSKRGNTPLHECCQRADLQLCRFFIHADPTLLAVTNQDGDGPLELAPPAFREQLLAEVIPESVVEGCLNMALCPVTEMHFLGAAGVGKTRLCGALFFSPPTTNGAGAATTPRRPTLGVRVLRGQALRATGGLRRSPGKLWSKMRMKSRSKSGGGGGGGGATAAGNGNRSPGAVTPRVTVYDYAGSTPARGNMALRLPTVLQSGTVQAVVVVVVSLAAGPPDKCASMLNYWLALLRGCRGGASNQRPGPARGCTARVVVVATHADHIHSTGDLAHYRRVLSDTLQRWQREDPSTTFAGGSGGGQGDSNNDYQSVFCVALSPPESNSVAKTGKGKSPSSPSVTAATAAADAMPDLIGLLSNLTEVAATDPDAVQIPVFAETVREAVELIRQDAHSRPCVRLHDALESIRVRLQQSGVDAPPEVFPYFLRRMDACGEVTILPRAPCMIDSPNAVWEGMEASAAESTGEWVVFDETAVFSGLLGVFQGTVLPETQVPRVLRDSTITRQQQGDLVLTATDVEQLTSSASVFAHNVSAASRALDALLVLQALHACTTTPLLQLGAGGGEVYLGHGVDPLQSKVFAPVFAVQRLADLSDTEQAEVLRVEPIFVTVGRRFTPPRRPRGIVFPPNAVATLQTAIVGFLQRHWGLSQMGSNRAGAGSGNVRVRMFKDVLTVEQVATMQPGRATTVSDANRRATAKVIFRAQTLETVGSGEDGDASALQFLDAFGFREMVDVIVSTEEHDSTAVLLLEALRENVLAKWLPWLAQAPAETEQAILARCVTTPVMGRVETSKLHEAADTDFLGCRRTSRAEKARTIVASAIRSTPAVEDQRERWLALQRDGNATSQQMETAVDNLLAPVHMRWSELERQWRVVRRTLAGLKLQQQRQQHTPPRTISSRDGLGSSSPSIGETGGGTASALAPEQRVGDVTPMQLRQLLVEARMVMSEVQHLMQVAVPDMEDLPVHPVLIPFEDEAIADDGGSVSGLTVRTSQSSVSMSIMSAVDDPDPSSVKESVLQGQFRLRFVCPVSGRISEGNGYELHHPKAQIQAIAPLLRRTVRYLSPMCLGALVVAEAAEALGLLSGSLPGRSLSRHGAASLGSPTTSGSSSGGGGGVRVGSFLADSSCHLALQYTAEVIALLNARRARSVSRRVSRYPTTPLDTYPILLSLLRELECAGPSETPADTGLVRVQGGVGEGEFVAWVHNSVAADVRRLGRQAATTAEEEETKAVEFSNPTTAAAAAMVATARTPPSASARSAGESATVNGSAGSSPASSASSPSSNSKLPSGAVSRSRRLRQLRSARHGAGASPASPASTSSSSGTPPAQPRSSKTGPAPTLTPRPAAAPVLAPAPAAALAPASKSTPRPATASASTPAPKSARTPAPNPTPTQDQPASEGSSTASPASKSSPATQETPRTTAVSDVSPSVNSFPRPQTATESISSAAPSPIQTTPQQQQGAPTQPPKPQAQAQSQSERQPRVRQPERQPAPQQQLQPQPQPHPQPQSQPQPQTQPQAPPPVRTPTGATPAKPTPASEPRSAARPVPAAAVPHKKSVSVGDVYPALWAYWRKQQRSRPRTSDTDSQQNDAVPQCRSKAETSSTPAPSTNSSTFGGLFSSLSSFLGSDDEDDNDANKESTSDGDQDGSKVGDPPSPSAPAAPLSAPSPPMGGGGSQDMTTFRTILTKLCATEIPESVLLQRCAACCETYEPDEADCALQDVVTIMMCLPGSDKFSPSELMTLCEALKTIAMTPS